MGFNSAFKGLNRYSNRLPSQVICSPILYTSSYIRTPKPTTMIEDFRVLIWEIRSLNVRREARSNGAILGYQVEVRLAMTYKEHPDCIRKVPNLSLGLCTWRRSKLGQQLRC